MKKIKCILTLLLFLSVVSFAHALPDLQVWSLEYSSETGRLVANIYNQAPDPAEGGFAVRFYDNDTYIGEYYYGKTLPRYSIVAVYVKPVLSEGMHTFRAVADANNTIPEQIEGNNEKTLAMNYEIDRTPSAAVPIAQKSSESQDTFSYALIAAIILIVLIIIFWKFALQRKKGLRERLISTKMQINP